MLPFDPDTPAPYCSGDLSMTLNQNAKTYSVPGMSCAHCVAAVTEEVGRVVGVESVEVALPTKQVTVRGHDVDDGAVRAAIDEAGYEAAA
jgi:copper chaperone